MFKEDYKSNDNITNILIKASCLNQFYSTNIFNIYLMSNHILNLNIDTKLKNEDLSVVHDIASLEINGKRKNFYSFATKYCSHHNELVFPIYDSYVAKVLTHFNKIDFFYNKNNIDFKNYKEFVNVLKSFIKFYNLESFNLKEIDVYLWSTGKKYFNKIKN